MAFNVDLSKMFPEKAYAYLSAFLPGLFFETSILFGNPALIIRMIAKLGGTLLISPYETLAIALLLAFVIGNAFMLVPSLIQYVLSYVYRIGTFAWKRLCRWPVKPSLEWLLKRSASPELINLHRAVMRTLYGFSPVELNKAFRCWHTLAERLLQTRYGMEPENVTEGEWNILYWTLGKPTPQDARGSLAMITTHAIGWAGIAATRIEPALRSKYYLAFCLFLIINGLLHDWFVVRRRMNPLGVASIHINAVVREMRDPPRSQAASEPTH